MSTHWPAGIETAPSASDIEAQVLEFIHEGHGVRARDGDARIIGTWGARICDLPGQRSVVRSCGSSSIWRWASAFELFVVGIDCVSLAASARLQRE